MEKIKITAEDIIKDLINYKNKLETIKTKKIMKFFYKFYYKDYYNSIVNKIMVDFPSLESITLLYISLYTVRYRKSMTVKEFNKNIYIDRDHDIYNFVDIIRIENTYNGFEINLFKEEDKVRIAILNISYDKRFKHITITHDKTTKIIYIQIYDFIFNEVRHLIKCILKGDIY